MEVMQRPTSTMVAGAVEEGDIARAIAEVQAQVIMAKRFPRDETAAFTKIMKACSRKSLAEVAQYTYPRGGTNVEGPSIRLAEVIARHWGNIQYGFRELGRGIGGYSDVEAYAWDLETNVRVSRSLQVAHTRDKKSGTVKLQSDRDIYEHIASQAQRRVRACILEVVPGDVIDAAVVECNRALMSDGIPLEDTIRQMVRSFDNIQVTKIMLEEYLQHDIQVCTPAQVARLRGIYNAIKDGIATREQYFKVIKKVGETAEELDEKIMDREKSQVEGPKAEEEIRKCQACGRDEKNLGPGNWLVIFPDQPNGPFNCHACAVVAPGGKKEFPCPYCDFPAKSQSGLTRHISAKHPDQEMTPLKSTSEPSDLPQDKSSPEKQTEGRTEESNAEKPEALPTNFFAEFEARAMNLQKRFQDRFGFDAGNEKYFGILAKFKVRNVFEITDRGDRTLAIELTNALADAVN